MIQNRSLSRQASRQNDHLTAVKSSTQPDTNYILNNAETGYPDSAPNSTTNVGAYSYRVVAYTGQAVAKTQCSPQQTPTEI